MEKGVRNPAHFTASKRWFQYVEKRYDGGKVAVANKSAAKDFPKVVENITKEDSYTQKQVFEYIGRNHL